MADRITPQTTALRRDAIGLREVLFQSITDMAPGAALPAWRFGTARRTCRSSGGGGDGRRAREAAGAGLRLPH
jgi:hypothetical protein